MKWMNFLLAWGLGSIAAGSIDRLWSLLLQREILFDPTTRWYVPLGWAICGLFGLFLGLGMMRLIDVEGEKAGLEQGRFLWLSCLGAVIAYGLFQQFLW